MNKPFALFPVFVTDQLAATKTFYETYFGFHSEFYDESFYLHLKLDNGEGQLAFMMPAHPSQPDFLQEKASLHGLVISLETSDAKAAYEDALKNRLKIMFELKQEVFGIHHFMVEDPSGFVVDVVQHTEAVT